MINRYGNFILTSVEMFAHKGVHMKYLLLLGAICVLSSCVADDRRYYDDRGYYRDGYYRNYDRDRDRDHQRWDRDRNDWDNRRDEYYKR